jgi:hypothetical protein
MKGNCFIDIDEERQKIKDLLFILEKFNVSETAYRELTVFSEHIWFHQCQEEINSLVILK